LLGLLFAIVLSKPVLAFDCVCPDHGPGAASAVVGQGSDDCCPGQACHDGCAHVTAVVFLVRPLPLPHAESSSSIATSSPYRPLPLLGVFRPPIAG
jgi:hypothetical protein